MEPENRQRTESRLINEKEIHAIEEVISKVKSAGLFDQFRKECLADVDTKPAYHNLIQRVEKFVERFLNSQKWNSDLNKNQLRETLRRQLNNSGVMNIGVDRIIEQVVNPKILLGIKPKIDEAICDYFGINLKTLHQEQQKRKQQHHQCILQHQQFHQTTEDAFGAASGMYPAMSTYPWLQASVDASFHGPPGSRMTDIEVASSVDPSAVSGISYNPHNMGFGGMMQPYFMGSWMPGMESFNHNMQPIISGQPRIHGQSLSAFGDGSFSPLDAGVTPFSTTSPLLECVNTSFDTPSLPIPHPSIPSHGLPDTPLLSSTSSIGSSPRAPEMTQQPSSVAPPGILTGITGSVIKPPPPGSVPPPPGTVPVVPPASYTHFQTSLQPVPATPSITAVASQSLAKEPNRESVPETIGLYIKLQPSIPQPVIEQQIVEDDSLTTVCSCHRLSMAAEAMEDSETENNIQAVKRNEKMTESEHFKLENKKEVEDGRQTPEMQFDEDPLPLQQNFEDVRIVRLISVSEEPCNVFEGVEEIEDSISFDIGASVK